MLINQTTLRSSTAQHLKRLLLTATFFGLIASGCAGAADEAELAEVGEVGSALTLKDYYREVTACSGVTTTSISKVPKVGDKYHPNYKKSPKLLKKAKATNSYAMKIPVSVKIDTRYWDVTTVQNYLDLVNRYYGAANIKFLFSTSTKYDFTAKQVFSRIIKPGKSGQIQMIFSSGIKSLDGTVPDAFAHPKGGMVVMNKILMDRENDHALPFFNPVKPIGHELGHVLGLDHRGKSGTRNLMAQGTKPTNWLYLEPAQIVIMRALANYRYNGTFNKAKKS